MPLLQGQPFKLINPLENINQASEIFTIGYTGERFQNKKDYEDRLALYSQNIWTCQCTGKGCLTHKEAWVSESAMKVAAKAAVAPALHKPLLMLVHHSLSPLDQLVDASSILCYSQFHIGEKLTYLIKGIPVCVIQVKDAPRIIPKMNTPPITLNDDNLEPSQNSLLNGTSNGIVNPAENTFNSSNNGQQMHEGKEEACNKREMIPKLYTVLNLQNNSVIEDLSPRSLGRMYKVPSKDQLRLFIRSCALRHRGSTCTPWMVTEDLLQQHGIANKLPSLFLSPKPPLQPQKRKKCVSNEVFKKFKPEKAIAPKIFPTSNNNPKNTSGKDISKMFGQKIINTNKSSNITNKPILPLNSHTPVSSGAGSLTGLMPIPKFNPSLHGLKVPKKRGRPRLTLEEKERNKKLRQTTLFNSTSSLAGGTKFIKIKSKATEDYFSETPTPSMYPGLLSPYKSPLKRATTSETLMKLPLMRRLVHEYKTIKGVMGQYRRMAYTMDLVLGKLTQAQIELIPDEALKNDLYLRQQKVENKKLLNNMTPEERKDYMKKKAREVALERWKERKLKNLKIEDKTLTDLLPLPAPQLVYTPKGVNNSLFGDIVMITEFVKCYRELLLGEEKFKITSNILMEALVMDSENYAGYKVIVDIMCCLLPAIIHDDTSKFCKDLGLPISVVPINYQTAPELARLCLKKQEIDSVVSPDSDEYEQCTREETELPEKILTKLETEELWELAPAEIISILKALVHKVLGCSSLNAFMEETDEKLSVAFREKRLVLKKLAKERMEEYQKKRADKKPKGDQPKRQRGRPKGYSPKIGGNIQEFYDRLKQKEEEAKRPMVATVLQRRKSAEAMKKEKEVLEQLEKDRQKQVEDDAKKRLVERKYEDVLIKRDNLLRRQPIGYDREHNRYWIFHATTPGLHVEKGWIDPSTNCQFMQEDESALGAWTAATPLHFDEGVNITEPNNYKLPNKGLEKENSHSEKFVNKSELYENGCLSTQEMQPNKLMKSEDSYIESDDEKPLSIVMCSKSDEDEKPLSAVKSKLSEDEDNKSLASIKSKLTLSPMKMANRGRPPKEAYVLVDEDTQTFPTIETNSWHFYLSMDDVKTLLEALSDKGQRESQLLASINLNKDRLQYHYNSKPETTKLMSDDTVSKVKQSLTEEIIQIERELIEGWLGGISTFDKWEAEVSECTSVHSLGELLMEAQKCMQLKFLKGLMAPARKLLTADSPDVTPEYEDIEGTGVLRWREAVQSCLTFSRMHVLVGMFDSSIKWERSMATRKCKVCRSKQKDDPLLMCEKCENSYHTYCLRPPLKGDIPDSWLCPMCAPKKVRRDKEEIEVEEREDPDEKEDPTFSVTRSERACKKKSHKLTPKVEVIDKKIEHECCICLGRIGLIFCSRCSTAYHSECHDPPLQSRARKDWVCATCLTSKSCKNKRVETVEGPIMRRNVFGDLEEIVPKENRVSTTCPRNSGNNLKKEEVDDDSDEELDRKAVRGAKAKALSKGKSLVSRRSGRTTNRKSYIDESEAEASSSSDDEADEETSEKESPKPAKESNDETESDSVDSETAEGEYADNETAEGEYADNETAEVEYADNETAEGEYADNETNVTYNETEENNTTYDDEVDSEDNQSFDGTSDEEKSSDYNQDEYSDDQLPIRQEMSEDEC